VSGVIVAFAVSVPLGIALGVLGAARTRGSVRPCRRLREHGGLATWSCGSVTLGGAVTLAIASAQVNYQRTFLAVTCGAIVLLVAVVAWLLLVETDDGDAEASGDEPEWWPTFERELEAWSRETRALSRSAR
jgi:hypothetical protein